MEAKITSRGNNEFTVQITIPYSKNMIDSEEKILQASNAVGLSATSEVLGTFDADGSVIKFGSERLTSKGQEPKAYQTPYGETIVERHVYQNSAGGATYCPLEIDARIIITSTPRFAKMVSSKYGEHGATQVIKDLDENHGRSIARSFVQNVSEAVAASVEAKESTWNYDLPDLSSPVKSVSIGLDGTCMLLCHDGFRETMVGTIALYDKNGNRMHTIYTGATPEYGKKTFISRLEEEIARIKSKYPTANYIGIADGAKDNWPFLKKHTSTQILDFWHATQYLSDAADVVFSGKKNHPNKKEWLDDACHKLKHNVGGASRLLTEMKLFQENSKISMPKTKKLKSAITYFTNNKARMKYAANTKHNYPIGSGVTEAACKVIVKERLCGSGMKWKEPGAASVLRLRTMNYSRGRWAQFWNKVGQYGLPFAA